MKLTLQHAPFESPRVAIFERLAAECTQLYLTVESEQRGATDRHREIMRMLDVIEQAARTNPEISVADWGAQIPVRAGSKLISTVQATATVRLRMRLREGEDLFGHLERWQGFVDGLPPVGKGEYQPGSVRLACIDPESHREALLGRLAEQSGRTAGLFGPKARARVSGLEGPVVEWQLTRREVALGIEYRLEIRG